MAAKKKTGTGRTDKSGSSGMGQTPRNAAMAAKKKAYDATRTKQAAGNSTPAPTNAARHRGAIRMEQEARTAGKKAYNKVMSPLSPKSKKK